YLGRVREYAPGGPTERATGNWSLLCAADAKKYWRPGGYQHFTVHATRGRLYPLIHPDAEAGTQKNPAAEIWAFDLAARKRIARIPGENAIALTAIQDGPPRLVALDAMTMGLVLIDAGDKPRVVQRMDGVAEAATLVEM